ncbi:MAG: hypothetical protein ACLGH0_15405, partial [Thermoanaerobaculia bacterium]
MRKLASLVLLVAACATPQLERRALSPPNADGLRARRSKPVMSPEIQAQREQELATARANYEKNPNDADAIIWLGRRTAYLGNYDEAIAVFTEGIRKHPTDARMLRHRGHRWITLRRFDKAVADLTTAAELIRGKEDEIEPDGLPNARNLPLTTLQSN